MLKNFKEWTEQFNEARAVSKELRHAYRSDYNDVEKDDWQNSEIRMPKTGDVVIAQATAVFRGNANVQGNWIQPKHKRDLGRQNMPMYIIAGPQDPKRNNMYPAFVFSQSPNRNKRTVYMDLSDLHDVTDAYPEDERQGRNIWLWVKSKNSRYRDIYNQWNQNKAIEYDPLFANIKRTKELDRQQAQAPVEDEPLMKNLQMAHYNPNDRLWKMQLGEIKVYETFPIE